jgi:hypothetical protein
MVPHIFQMVPPELLPAVTRRVYGNLKFKKAFVTGGSGFVGRALIQTLVG